MEFPKVEQDPREALIIAITAAILVEAIEDAESKAKSNPAADVVLHWMKPYIEKIEQASEAVNLLMGFVK